LNELELERAMEEATKITIYKKPENREIAHFTKTLPAYYKPETTFRHGSKIRFFKKKS